MRIIFSTAAIVLGAAMLMSAPQALAQVSPSASAAPIGSAEPPGTTPEPTPIGTPSATPSPETTPTPSPDMTPTPDPERRLLEADVVALAFFECDRRDADGNCFVDVDDRGLTFTAAFDGAGVVSSRSDNGFAFWSLELPGTAFGTGPGGSVGVVLTAAPADVFRVLDVDCVRDATPFEAERGIPSTLQGNSVFFEFEVAPKEDRPTYACRFTFDSASLPRFTPPPTDTDGVAAAMSDDTGRFALATLIGLLGGVLFIASHQHGSTRVRVRVVPESGVSTDS